MHCVLQHDKLKAKQSTNNGAQHSDSKLPSVRVPAVRVTITT